MDQVGPSTEWLEQFETNDDLADVQANLLDMDFLSGLLDQRDEMDTPVPSPQHYGQGAAHPDGSKHAPCCTSKQVIPRPKGVVQAIEPVSQRRHVLSPDDQKDRRRVQQANNARRQRIRKKTELSDLKTEEYSLIQQLEVLRYKQQHPHTDEPSPQWKNVAAMERRKRGQVEAANDCLRRDVYIKNAYVRSLKAALSLPEPNRVEMNMCYFLHTPMHLPKDAQPRARALEAVCTKSKLDLASRILQNETGSTRPFTTPKFSWIPLNVGSACFGVTSIAVYALDTTNVRQTFNAASNAIVTCGVIWPSYSLVNSSVNQFDVSSTKLNIRYRLTENRFQSSTSNEQVLIESRDMSYCRVGDTESIFVWDYIDDDNLHPMKKTTTVKRSTVGALLVRREQCDDAVERVVCRYICTKTHSIHSAELSPDIQRFSKSSEVGAQVADSLVFETIKGGVCLSAS